MGSKGGVPAPRWPRDRPGCLPCRDPCATASAPAGTPAPPKEVSEGEREKQREAAWETRRRSNLRAVVREAAAGAAFRGVGLGAVAAGVRAAGALGIPGQERAVGGVAHREAAAAVRGSSSTGYTQRVGGSADRSGRGDAAGLPLPLQCGRAARSRLGGERVRDYHL